MKKIAFPVFLAAVILGCALYVGAKTIGPVHMPVTPGHTPGKPITLSDGSITMTVSTDNTNILKGSEGGMVVHIDLEAVQAQVKGRGPLNLVLVIDRSGSMADRGKLEYARQAARELVDRLGKNDRIAVVIYDDVAEILVPSTPATNPEAIKQMIEKITDRGSTNLSDGLVLGHSQVRKYFDSEAINQIIILSDGLANRGITDENELERMVAGWSEAGIRVTSMGLGADFNEDLMMGLANASGGHYHFIESPTQLAGIYEKELRTLMQTVGKDVKVVLDLADGVKFEKVYGYDARVKGSTVEIPAGIFNSGQHRVIMAHLKVPTNKVGKADVAGVRLNYRDALQDSKMVTSVAKVQVDCVADVAKVEKTRNLEVEGYNYWFGNSNENAAAIDDFQDGEKDKAIGWYEAKIRDIRKKNKVYGNDQLESQAKQYEEELDELKSLEEPASEDGRNFIKGGKASQRLDALGYVR